MKRQTRSRTASVICLVILSVALLSAPAICQVTPRADSDNRPRSYLDGPFGSRIDSISCEQCHLNYTAGSVSRLFSRKSARSGPAYALVGALVLGGTAGFLGYRLGRRDDRSDPDGPAIARFYYATLFGSIGGFFGMRIGGYLGSSDDYGDRVSADYRGQRTR